MVAGVALLAAIAFFLFRRQRSAGEDQGSVAPIQLEESRETPGTPGTIEEAKTPVIAEMYSPGRNELATDKGVHGELSGEARAPAELDAGYSSMDGK